MKMPKREREILAICPHCGKVFLLVPGGVCPDCAYPFVDVLERGSAATPSWRDSRGRVRRHHPADLSTGGASRNGSSMG